MVAVASKLLGPGHPDVEDAAQEALIAVARSLPGYRAEGSIVAYANRIAVRTTLHVARRGRARVARHDHLARAEAVSEIPQPADPAGDAQRRRLLRESLSTLPDEQAEALALRVCLGSSLHEVAAETGVPVNTVRSRLRLAKEALRRRMIRMTGGTSP
jgi:RNA polymerase sigma-70 factor (ECF subfamily)